MKIVFLLLEKYPTTKAYGVTTSRTAESLFRLGHEPLIMCSGKRKTDELGNRIVSIGSEVNLLTKLYGIRILKIGNIAYHMQSLSLIYKFKKIIKKCPVDLIITRSVLAAFLLRKHRVKILVEIHHSLSNISSSLIRSLNEYGNIGIFTLNLRLQGLLAKYIPESKLGIVPMGVSNDFFLAKKKMEFNDSKLILGYVGKAESSGHDNGLLNLLNIVFEANKSGKIKSEIELYLVGVEPLFLERIAKNQFYKHLLNRNVKIHNHVPNSKVPEFMAKIQVGVIPYPNTQYHNERFPIKILEYSATRCLLLLSDTDAHRELANEFAVFYKNDNLESFIDAIKKCIIEAENSSKMIDLSFKWAEDYNYEARSKKILMQAAKLSENVIAKKYDIKHEK